MISFQEEPMSELDQALSSACRVGDFKEAVRLVNSGAKFANINLQFKISSILGYFNQNKEEHFLRMATCVIVIEEQKDELLLSELDYVFKLSCCEFRTSPKFLRLMRIVLLLTGRPCPIPPNFLVGKQLDLVQQQLAVPYDKMPHIFEAEYKLLTDMRFLVIKERAIQICIALQELNLDANRLCEIILAACEPTSREIPFYKIWDLVVKIKHFKE